jgi:DNA-binding MarR family transcriptional regulator
LTECVNTSVNFGELCIYNQKKRMGIEDLIKQEKFSNEAEKTIVNISFTNSYLSGLLNSAIRDFNISLQQFNVLRILQGQHPSPVSINEITSRMVDKMSNASRLVDKLDDKELVKRKTSCHDKRQVDISITETGQKTLSELNVIVNQIIQDHSHLTPSEYEMLNHLLDKLRK